MPSYFLAETNYQLGSNPEIYNEKEGQTLKSWESDLKKLIKTYTYVSVYDYQLVFI
ncbi:hypothetical protein ACTXT7_014377 [Hymenolepis weldensis]